MIVVSSKCKIMISNYVQKIKIKNEEYYYHTLNHKCIRINNYSQLNENLFFKKYDKESLYNRIFKNPSMLQLYIAPTWECTLRCPFCYVLHQLDNKKTNNIDINQLDKFITNYISYYNIHTISISFLGGEALLNIDSCNEISDYFMKINNIKLLLNITTNLTIPLENKHIEFLKKIRIINVSLDGPLLYHNKQRKTHKDYKDLNPGLQTLKNLKILSDNNLLDKVIIQSALTQEALSDKEALKEHIFILETIGIKKEKILLGTIANTDFYKKQNRKNNSIRKLPCCVFRYMSFFTIDSEGLFGNFFDKKKSFLGNFDTHIETIKEKYQQYILDTMPVLKDEKCLSCPALGHCWGSCYGEFENKNKPSQHCNQEEIVNKMIKKINSEKFNNQIKLNNNIDE